MSRKECGKGARSPFDPAGGDRWRATARLLVALTGGVALGCSGTECGPGTVERDGVCVAAPADGGQTGGDSGMASADGADAADAADPNPCPTDLPGPAMVPITGPDGRRFCMDSTKVTVGHYMELLDAVPWDYPEEDFCRGNNLHPTQPELVIDQDCIQNPPGSDGRLDVPMTCVDRCDARRYCEWAGKRLCGRSEPLSQNARVSICDGTASRDVLLESEWLVGCSGGDGEGFPYGDEYEAGRCPQELEPVGSPSCEGGFPGLFDMLAFPPEFSGECDDAGHRCVMWGVHPMQPDFSCPAAALHCAVDPLVNRSGFGLRCCADIEGESQ